MMGSSLNQYRITASIGAGGMGEVFRARDTRLNRDVAVKVLPKDFALDADRLRRFEQEARALANACLYPPAGKRSNGPIRAVMYGEASAYQAIANDEVLVIPMIETQEAIDNIDAILDVPGISGIYIGPSDLGLSLGLVPKLDREEPQILTIYDKLLAAIKKRNLFAGIHNGTASYAARAFGMGFQLCTIANDSGLMAMAARAAVSGFRKEVGAAADK